jgi:hypothetical protein
LAEGLNVGDAILGRQGDVAKEVVGGFPVRVNARGLGPPRGDSLGVLSRAQSIGSGFGLRDRGGFSHDANQNQVPSPSQTGLQQEERREIG